MSPKMKTLKGKGLGVRSLTRNTSGVKGCVGATGWGLARLRSNSITHTDLHKPNNKLIITQLDTFGARMSHEQTRTHNIHHNSDLGEPTTFHFIRYYVLGHKASTQMSLCLEIPKWESRNSQNWGSYDFGGP
jgi:hypothetical protein